MDNGYDVSTSLDELITTSQDSEERELFFLSLLAATSVY